MTTHTATAPRVTGLQRVTIVEQIGRGNVLAVSGGRVRSIAAGVELPVSNGYRVTVELAANDTYIVSRVFVRGGRVFVKGVEDGVYAEQVGETAYRASCFRNVEFGFESPVPDGEGGWTVR